jgi:hypothetical protein
MAAASRASVAAPRPVAFAVAFLLGLHSSAAGSQSVEALLRDDSRWKRFAAKALRRGKWEMVKDSLQPNLDPRAALQFRAYVGPFKGPPECCSDGSGRYYVVLWLRQTRHGWRVSAARIEEDVNCEDPCT